MKISVCPKCKFQTETKKKEMFCTKCGTKMKTRFCLACKNDLKIDDQFCTRCGAKRDTKYRKIGVGGFLIICTLVFCAFFLRWHKESLLKKHIRPIPAAQTVPFEYDIYEVREGVTLSLIARTYGVTEQDIRKANGLGNDVLQPGQKLKIPKKRSPIPEDKDGRPSFLR